MENNFFEAQIRFAKEQGGDYSAAYQDGLRKAYHGESYSTRYHGCEGDERAEGFSDGIAGKPHRESPKNLGNHNAVSGEEPATSQIQMRVTPSEKSAWVKAAQRDGKNLSQWIRDTLNAAL